MTTSTPRCAAALRDAGSQTGHKGYIIPVGGSTAAGLLWATPNVRPGDGTVQANGRGHARSATSPPPPVPAAPPPVWCWARRLFLPDAKATGLGVDTDPFEDIVPELVKEAVRCWSRRARPADMDMPLPHDLPCGRRLRRPQRGGHPLYRRAGPDRRASCWIPVYTGKAYADHVA